MHALIIEDEPLVAMLVEDTLRQCGFASFDVAVSNAAAVSSASERCPDLITADVELNPGSGIDAVNEICAGSPVPVVFVTGSPSAVNDRMPHHPLILKPFEPSELIALVQIVLAEAQMSPDDPVTINAEISTN